MKRFIVVKFEVDGVHSWPECPIEEVSFLKFPHRHMFHFEAVKEVTHNDRDVEIIQLKHDMLGHLSAAYYAHSKRTHFFNRMSCEEIAEELIKKFSLKSCKVLEDNENGAYLEA
jgi:hypothetical protein